MQELVSSDQVRAGTRSIGRKNKGYGRGAPCGCKAPPGNARLAAALPMVAVAVAEPAGKSDD